MIEQSYTIIQAAKLLSVSVRTLRQWISDGKVNAYKFEFGRNWYIRESELKRLMGGKSVM